MVIPLLEQCLPHKIHHVSVGSYFLIPARGTLLLKITLGKLRGKALICSVCQFSCINTLTSADYKAHGVPENVTMGFPGAGSSTPLQRPTKTGFTTVLFNLALVRYLQVSRHSRNIC